MRETRSLPQKNQEDRGQSSKLDAVRYPSPKALADLLTERAASGRLEANDALKELFSPVLLRQAIWRSLERSHTGQLTHELVALCFVFNPKETLQEINFLKFQPYKSRGNASVWSETAKGLIQGCLIKPSLWANLEPRQRSIINGPDIVANCTKKMANQERRESRPLLSASNLLKALLNGMNFANAGATMRIVTTNKSEKEHLMQQVQRSKKF